RLGNQFEIRPNLALSQNQNRNFHATLDGDLQDFGNTAISFSPQIVAGNMLRYRPVENLQVKLLPKFVEKQYISNIEDDDSQLDDYLVDGLNVQYPWITSPLFKEIVFSGLVNNIFGEKYVSNGYYSPGDGPAYFPQAGINFLTGIRMEF